MTTTARAGVYIVCDWAGAILYVGSTTCGVRNRVICHLRDVDRTLDWATVWVVPLAEDTPAGAVRRVEGLIGRSLRPRQTKLLPAV
jgi:Uri superfamily endonuclease